MTKLLNGLELQSYIKARQLRQVRNLRQEHHIVPRLLILKSLGASPVIDAYVRMKTKFAEDIEVEVIVESLSEADMINRIAEANIDSKIQGIIIQLPLDDISQTDTLCNKITPEKDVDGLGVGSLFPSATAQAIDWLLAGYGIDLTKKHIAIVGNGRLVGNPLSQMWKSRGYMVTILDDSSDNIPEVLRASDVIVSATGSPRIVKSCDVKPGAIVVDAGTASEKGKIVGDVAEDVRERKDLTITPKKGGVGPLTYTVLFDHLIEACLKKAGML